MIARSPVPPGLDMAVELAHDMRSPLSAMITMADLLKSGASGPVTPEQSRQLELMLQAARGLSRVTSDMIESARDHATGREPVASFAVDDVLTCVREVTQPMVESAGVTLIVRNQAPGTWLGRRSAVTRVMLNLTTNALKYTQQGVVECGAQLRGSNQLEFFVRDTGGGLRPVIHGTGLGLNICRRLLHSMGSSLDVESRPGIGCRFSFSLAFREAA